MCACGKLCCSAAAGCSVVFCSRAIRVDLTFRSGPFYLVIIILVQYRNIRSWSICIGQARRNIVTFDRNAHAQGSSSSFTPVPVGTGCADRAVPSTRRAPLGSVWLTLDDEGTIYFYVYLQLVCRQCRLAIASLLASTPRSQHGQSSGRHQALCKGPRCGPTAERQSKEPCATG